MSKGNRLLLVTAYFPPHPGGVEYYALNIARELSHLGWEVAVVTTARRGAPYSEEKLGKIKVYRLPYRLVLSNTPISLRWFWQLRRIMHEVSADVVNVHAPVPGLPDLATALAGSTPVVVSYHSGSMKKQKVFPDALVWLYEKLIGRHMLRKAQAIVCSSDYVREQFLNRYIQKCETVTPGVDATFFMPARRQNTGRRVLFVGSLNRSDTHKGLHFLLEAIRRLSATYPDLSLTVVGEGDAKVQYRRLCSTLDIDSRVVFSGRLKGKRLAQAYRSADLFVLPTTNDSFPMVILEAMASGLPVISTTVGGIPSMIKSGDTGILVPPGDVDSLCKAMRELLQDPRAALKISRAARSSVTATLSWSQQAKCMNDILLKALRPQPNIVQISAYYPPHLGGLERVAQEVSSRLASGGYNVDVVTSDIGAAAGSRQEDALTVQRLRSFEFAHTAFIPALFWRLLRAPKPSIFHLHLAQAYVPEVTLFVARLRRIPYIVHFHLDVEPSGPLGFLFLLYKKTVQRLIIRGAVIVIALSPSQKKMIERVYHKKPSEVIYIPNGVSDRHLALGMRRRQLHAPVRLLFVGRLTNQKRVDRLLDALAYVMGPVQVEIVGDGEDRNILQKQAKELKLNNVHFLGALSAEETLRHYESSDIFVLPSNKEGMPLALLEAMAAGLPVIGSDVMGIKELVDGNGILVSDPSPQNFADAINALIGDSQRAQELSDLGFKKARQYSWGKLIKRLSRLYAEVAHEYY